MVCSECGAAQTPGRRYCGECGAKLAARCPACGVANPPGDKFCGECGTPLTGGAPSSVAGTRAGDEVDPTERRLVSVLFVDLVGFTAYSEGRDPEDVRAMLGRYFDAATDAVTRHGGSVEKFIGDAVMAVWGTPVAHEDDAERAVRSALEIVDRVAVLGVQLGVDLKARGGVLTGEAVASLGAVDQVLVTGDLVNTASRLQSAADPGSVLVGERTYRSSSGAIEYDPVEPVRLKGKADELPAWRALRILGERGGSGRGAAPEPPFVGRDEELRLIKELLHATGREARPRLVHMTGVGGIGKSRLVWELLKYVDGLTEDIFWHQGRCPSYGEGVSFWALAEMVRGRAGIAETDDEPESREKLEACLEGFAPDAEERAWLAPRLSHLLGLGPVPSGGREELFGAWRRFFELVSLHGTTVLVVEELHRADPGLLDFLQSLLEWSRTSPIVVLTLARPELAERRESWGVGVRNATTVHVSPLPDHAMTAMLTGFVDGLENDAVAALVRRAEGVPLYLVETVRMLVDRGVLEQAGERYRTVGDAGLALRDLDVPETLHALVAARLDALPEAERWLVQDASVAGHSFTVDTVSAVTGRDREDVEPSLRALVRKEVLDLDVDPRSTERGQYRFVQSVIREVAYSTLSKKARRTKHLACARWFEAQDDEDLAGIVATHYLDAYRADPSAEDAAELAERSRTWVRRAADRAFALGSPELAYAYAQQGLELESDPGARAELNLVAGRARRIYAGHQDAWSDLYAAIELYRSLGDLRGEAEAYIEAARLDAGPDGNAELESRMPELLLAMGDDYPREAGLLWAASSDRHYILGRREEALDASEHALVLAQAIHDNQLLMHAATSRAGAVNAVGRPFEARLLWDAAADLARRDGSSSVLAPMLLLQSLGVVVDDPMAAIDIALESMVHAEKAGNRPVVEMNTSNLAEVFLDTGHWDRAEEMLASMSSFRGVDEVNEMAARFCALQLRAHRGDPEGALSELEELAGSSTVDPSFIQMRTWFLRMRGLARFLAGDPAGALADGLEGLDLDPLAANGATNLWLAVQAASTLRDRATLAQLLDSSRGMRGRWVETVRHSAAANCAALTDEDEPTSVIRRMEEVLGEWLDLDLHLDHALEVLCVAHVLGAGAVPPPHARSARAFLEGLDAVSMVRLYDEVGL